MADAPARVPGALLRRAPAVVLCALVAHVAVYHSLWPADGMHSYFAWYAPLVAALSALSILFLPVVLAVALVGRRESAPVRAIRSIISGGTGSSDAVTETVRLAAAALVFLAVQESLEHSLALHRVAPASFSPPVWAVLLAAVTVVSGALAWVRRAVAALVEGLLKRRRPPALRPTRVCRPSGLADSRQRLRPLAVHGGLRAPPIGA